jgi:hypothetical protein
LDCEDEDTSVTACPLTQSKTQKTLIFSSTALITWNLADNWLCYTSPMYDPFWPFGGCILHLCYGGTHKALSVTLSQGSANRGKLPQVG